MGSCRADEVLRVLPGPGGAGDRSLGAFPARHAVAGSVAPGRGYRGLGDLVGVGGGQVGRGQPVGALPGRRRQRGPGLPHRALALWRYSRHPNYFFEWLHWPAYVPVAYGHALLWAILFAPVLLLLSIRFITGIPPIERRSVERRGEEYRRYQRTTSAFIP